MLTDRARSLLHELGYTVPTRNWSSGFSFDAAFRRYLADGFSSSEVRRLLTAGRPPLYAFWYRTSPDLLLPAEFSVTPDDLPRSHPGEAYIELDLQGRLSHLEIHPTVGRDVLVGCLLGLGKALLSYVKEVSPNRLSERPWTVALSGGLQGPARLFLDTLFDGLALTLEFMLLLLALRILLRREGLATAILWALLTFGIAAQGPYTGLSLACSGLGALLMALAWIRFGPLAGMTGHITAALCLRYPLTLDTSVWYTGSGLFAILILTALALYGFGTAVAGQPWFARSGVLDD